MDTFSSLRRVTLALAILISSSTVLAELPERWEISRLGYYDSAHTSTTGRQYTSYTAMIDSGQVVGNSYRYSGTSITGYTTWIHDSGINTRIGLYGTGYVRDDGSQFSYIKYLATDGTASGTSNRYSGMESLGTSAWYYNGSTTVQAGFTDAVHTRSSDGYQNSTFIPYGANTTAAGHSTRYSASSVESGQTGWRVINDVTYRIGLYDAAYTTSSGYQSTTINGSNAAGQLVGTSEMSGTYSTMRGRSAWIANGAVTTRIGLIDAEHTDFYGVQNASFRGMSDSGFVIGYSDRIDGGQSGWVYNGSSTRRVGLTGSDFVSYSGSMETTISRLSESGYVAGSSYQHGTNWGNAAWVYNGVNTQKIGLYNGVHRSSVGTQYVNASELNERGDVIGTSSRYAGNSNNGVSAWIYTGGFTRQLGFTGTGYQRNDGYQYHYLDALNDNGQVVGASSRYSGADNIGLSAWFYDNGITTRLGLSGAAYTSDSGNQMSRVKDLNEQGQAVGFSNFYEGESFHGRSSWLYDHDSGEQRDIGLSGEDYTRNDGYHETYADQLNENGQVVGTTRRFVGDSVNSGEVSWLYDFELDETFEFNLSESDTGTADSDVMYFDESGLVLGRYALYDGATYMGARAFYFTIEDGLWDLGELLGLSGVDIADHGWESLASAIHSGDLGHILGYIDGYSYAGGQSMYLMTPAEVPVPATAWLLGSALVGLVGVKRKSNG
ncbi:VPLPA-CTERM sorting domain-containing protein [Oceanicoccus sp. KOV_DT_Chl]|uniref:VPLPA-CTERM sorting domain-containing protein n=1 Tax=Oceanicoccus sp. KOV_DT_Chl TaxID=1904639 RepID=UPI000C7D87FF|nr:VPLPA-CTERM sorting domain-containing protein [Oceanicoccus sp. KOV_DT_Chl]